jgi:hypothetical protein
MFYNYSLAIYFILRGCYPLRPFGWAAARV